MKITLRILAPLLVLAFGIFAGFINYKASWFAVDKHFSLLAQSFIHGDLFLSPINLPNGDYVDFFGKQYLFFGPIPSILLTPFVFIWGKNFPQMVLSISSLVAVFLATLLLCRKHLFSKPDSLWLANFFVFGTVLYFVGVVNISAYVVQAVGAAFVMLSLLEYFTKRRWLLIGILIALAGGTRITLFGFTLFFLLELLRQRVDTKRSLALLLVPILVSISILGIYNFRRFHSFFETGYTKNVTVVNKDNYNHIYGYFSLSHIPANLYSMLVMAPEPIKDAKAEFFLKFPYLKANGFGMAIWFTSPLFLYLIFAKRSRTNLSAIVAAGLIAVPSLLYWGIGASQYGYRYSLDFLPLLFLLLLSSFKKDLPGFAKLLITFGVIFNGFYMLSIWNSYPFLEFFQYLNW